MNDFHYQEAPDTICVTVDTDHAGCLDTRKSTSGGIVMLGTHCIKTWSTNQQVVATSSGEAEYYGMVKGASNGLGVQGMLRDSGVILGITLCTDSSAAKGIASRRGLGKVRHIELAELWVQDQVERGRIQIRKIGGKTNVADMLTKYLDGRSMKILMEHLPIRIRQSRHRLAVDLHECGPVSVL